MGKLIVPPIQVQADAGSDWSD